jgi:hypothetical protein
VRPLGVGHFLPACKGGLQEREAEEPLRMAGHERQRRRSAGGVADQVETVEARVVRDSRDAGDLRRERVVGRRRLGGVDLQLLGPSVDRWPHLGEEPAVRGFGGHDPAGKQDDLPGMIEHVEAPMVPTE